MREGWRRCARCFEDKDVLERVREMILPTNDMTDAQVHVIGAGCHVVCRHPVTAEKSEVLDVMQRFEWLTVDGIPKLNVFQLRTLRLQEGECPFGKQLVNLKLRTRHPEAQDERLARVRAMEAFVLGQVAHAR